MLQIMRNLQGLESVYIIMEVLSNILVQFTKVCRGFTMILSVMSCAFVAAAQERHVVNPPVSDPVAKATSTSAPSNPAEDYKRSLNELSLLYANTVTKLEKENNQLKQLYRDGLISRLEMEASDRSLAEARAKGEAIQKQIIAANQPLLPNAPDETLALTASDQAWTTGNAKVDGLIKFYGKKYAVDPYLVFCLMSQESSFSANAISPKGAQGLMQLMPATAARYGVTNPYDMAQSIMGGTRYLKDLLQMFNGRIDLALAGYNAGEGAVIKYGYTVPPYSETRNYVRLISMRYTRKKTTTPKSESSTVPALDRVSAQITS